MNLSQTLQYIGIRSLGCSVTEPYNSFVRMNSFRAVLFASVAAWLLTCDLNTLKADAPDDKPASKSAVPADHVERAKKGTTLFRDHIREILTKHCLKCHGGQSIKGDFNLATRDLLVDSGYLGEDAAGSHLLDVITHASEPNMPLQSEKLSEESIDKIREWINLGAPYDKPLGDAHNHDKAMRVTVEDRAFWSFKALQPVAVPDVRLVEWCRTPIDRFILSKQEAMGLKPNGFADPRTLVRRASFDLRGLPAALETVNAVSGSSFDEAWPKFISQQLESEHYGERWARHWMDIARFAESHGYEQDYDRPHAYHYRDFLIKALNADMPFDQFLKWQLAGDELAPHDPLAMMATGFLGAGAFPTQLTEDEFESARYDELDDMVATTGVAFLGLSVGCARCHDHKFDPIPSEDYYRMAATFGTAIRSEIDMDLQPEENARRQAAWEASLEELQRHLQKFEDEVLPGSFAEWIATYQSKEAQTPWKTLEVLEIHSLSGSKFDSQSDGSWLASGDAPAQDVLTIVGQTAHGRATKLRLEALAHPSLPHAGPGRAPNGNFALGDIQLSITNADGKSRAVAFLKATATHQQNLDSLSVAASIDTDQVTGWAVDQGGIGKDQAAVFDLVEPLELVDGSRLTIQLFFKHPNTRHAIGRFRLSVSDLPDAPVAAGSDELDPQVTAALAEVQRERNPASPAWNAAQSWFARTLPEWQRLSAAVETHRSKGPELLRSKVMVTSEGLSPMSHHADGRGFPHFYPETFVLSRGDVQQKQQVALAGFLRVLTPTDMDTSRWQVQPTAESNRTSFRRASLANWMTDVEHGAGSLVARVIVNRIWQHHFGRGLVATPNDFGTAGERPSHPELLDWLANDLVEHGWQLKRLHHLIMNSSVYMQSAEFDEARAEIDRENTLIWRWQPRRLEAEAIRDSLLAVSGRLDSTMYGPGSLDENMTRRSIYFFIKRSQLIPTMMLFDWPEHLVSIGQRSSTTIAPQALMLMNSEQGRACALALASQLPGLSQSDAIHSAYQRVFARSPNAQEASLALAFLKKQAALYQQREIAQAQHTALVDFCQSLMCMNEFVYIE
jgi:mono/diheme cytochrome c family protein